MKCGKEYECPAAKFNEADGFLDGINGGKSCVYITGTFCNRSIQGTFQDKEKHCGQCEYYLYLKGIHGNGLSVFSFSDYIKGHSPEKIGHFVKLK